MFHVIVDVCLSCCYMQTFSTKMVKSWECFSSPWRGHQLSGKMIQFLGFLNVLVNKHLLTANLDPQSTCWHLPTCAWTEQLCSQNSSETLFLKLVSFLLSSCSEALTTSMTHSPLTHSSFLQWMRNMTRVTHLSASWYFDVFRHGEYSQSMKWYYFSSIPGDQQAVQMCTRNTVLIWNKSCIPFKDLTTLPKYQGSEDYHFHPK